MVVVTITFISIVFGELVPKRLAYTDDGRWCPGRWSGSVIAPALRSPAHLVHRDGAQAAGVRGAPDAALTEEEIAASLEEGLDAGVHEAREHEMVRNVFA